MESIHTRFAKKDGITRISVGRVTPPDIGCRGPCAPSGNAQPNVRPTTVAAGRGLPALPGRDSANSPCLVGRVTPCAPSGEGPSNRAFHHARGGQRTACPTRKVGRVTPCAPSFRVCGRSGFTLTELLVVIATLALLAALMLPALSQGLDRDTSIKVQCANQLRQLGMAMTVLAGENTGIIPGHTNGYYLPARGGNAPGANQRAINLAQAIPDDFLAANMTNGVNKIWCCPSLPDYGQPLGLPYHTDLPVSGQVSPLLGYNYYGGIQYWVDSVYTDGTPSYSPVTLSQAHPAWVLIADCMNENVDGQGPSPWAIGNILYGVPHRRTGTIFPDGGNECFVDGSVTWVKVESTLQLTEFSSTYEWDYMYQSELPRAFNQFNLTKLAWPPPME